MVFDHIRRLSDEFVAEKTAPPNLTLRDLETPFLDRVRFIIQRPRSNEKEAAWLFMRGHGFLKSMESWQSDLGLR